MKLISVKNAMSLKRRSQNTQSPPAAGLAEAQHVVDARLNISSPASIQSSKVAWLLGLEAQPTIQDDTRSLQTYRSQRRRQRLDEELMWSASDEEEADIQCTTAEDSKAQSIYGDDESDEDDNLSDADTVEIPIMLEAVRPRIPTVVPAVVPDSPLDEAFEVEEVHELPSAETSEDDQEINTLAPSLIVTEVPVVAEAAAVDTAEEVVRRQTSRTPPPSPPKSVRRAALAKARVSVAAVDRSALIYEAPLTLPSVELTPLVVEQDTEYEDFCERMLLESLARPQWQARATSSSVSSTDSRLGLQTPSLSSSASSLASMQGLKVSREQQTQRDQAAHEAKLKLAAARNALKRVKVGGRAVQTPVYHAKVLEQVEALRIQLHRGQNNSSTSLASLPQESELPSPAASCASSIKSNRSSRRLTRERDFAGPKQADVRIGIAAPRDLQAYARSSAGQRLAGGPSAGLGQPRSLMPAKPSAKARSAITSYKPQTHITSIEERLL
ncbi:hypothetical protein BCR37DRAFT_393658 [Protomyces lactucae-debilis]|uniref:Uncharacterized protein n=1 Tax=Protomyces lactucae-debilis TaxID=2754530 RepID=A0A1Y2FDV0_PROLT|nr:uncharacterized protein BCR37DRAFT_393658 [Protomyces lactucae-debilis]ORY81025.1 hypothetical protein BCR37DRAFT_393658 [Protomyces lactucae-debilis]